MQQNDIKMSILMAIQSCLNNYIFVFYFLLLFWMKRMVKSSQLKFLTYLHPLSLKQKKNSKQNIAKQVKVSLMGCLQRTKN